MKSLFTLSLSFCLAHFGFSQWTDISTGKFKGAGICQAISKDTAVIAGSDGRIYTTYDGGLAFDSVQTIFDFGEWFNDLQFISPNKGYVCGGTAFGRHQSFLASTSDAGQSWDSLTSNQFGYNLLDLSFVNDQLGFIIGEHSFLLKTTDGGLSFDSVALPFKGAMEDVFFSSAQVGYVSLTESDANSNFNYRILKTTDQGANWNLVYSDSAQDPRANNSVGNISSLHFVTDQLGYGTKGNTHIVKTTDGGANWTAVALPIDTSFFAHIYFVNKDTGYVTSGYSFGGPFPSSPALATADGGITWHRTSLDFQSVSFVDGKTGYGVAGGKVYRTTNGGDIGLKEEQPKPFHIFPNPAQEKIRIAVSETLEIKAIILLDAQGKESRRFHSAQNPLDVAGLAAGNYILNIETNQGTFKEKIILN